MLRSRLWAHGRAGGLAAIGVALLACEAAPARPPSPVPAPGYTAVPPRVDAGAVDAAPDAPPPELAELDDPAPWVFRELGLGMIVSPRRQTSILRRVGDRASLRVELDGAPMESGDTPAAWSPVHRETFVGTSHRDRERTVFELVSARGTRLTLTCRADRLAVHRAGANLVPDPEFHDECGNRGVWRPRATRTVAVLSCAASDRDLDHYGQFGSTAMAFAPAPGVESLYINDDCIVQGGGYRLRSAADGR